MVGCSRLRRRLDTRAMSILLLLVLVPYFIFDSGLPHVLAGETRGILGVLNMENIERYGSNEDKAIYYDMFTYSFAQDVSGARWLAGNGDPKAEVYADVRSRQNVLTGYGMMPWWETNPLSPDIEPGSMSYIYLRYVNTVYGYTSYPPKTEEEGYYYRGDTADIANLLEKSNKIYSNGGSQIYYSR